MKTGEVYKDDSEWKAKGIAESDIRKDVRVIMPDKYFHKKCYDVVCYVLFTLQAQCNLPQIDFRYL